MISRSASRSYLSLKALHASRSFEPGSSGATQTTLATEKTLNPNGLHQPGWFTLDMSIQKFYFSTFPKIMKV